MNFLLVDLQADSDGLFVRVGPARLAVHHPGLETRVGQELILGLRPEDIEDARFSQDESAILEAVVALAEPLGAETIAYVEVDARPLRHHGSVEEARDVDGDIADGGLLDAAGRGALLTARLNARSEVEAGMGVRLAIDPRRLHLFDPLTEQTIV
jgi:multiple sugar transport system ATP-binding protein